MINRRRFITITACALATPTWAAGPIEWRGFGLGSDLSLKLWCDPELAQRAIAEVEQIIKTVETTFSIYNPASDLSRLNREKSLHMSPLFARLLEYCDAAHSMTNGYFDPSVQSVWSGGGNATDRWSNIVRDDQKILLGPQHALTFNGIAQGFATDLAKSALSDLGLSRVLVNLGEFAGLGGPFAIGVSDPDAGLIDIETIENMTIATSSPWAMHVGNSGHIINPVTGAPPNFTTLRVIHDSAAMADGLSTGLVFATDQLLQSCIDAPMGPKSIIGRRTSGEIVRFG